MVVVVKLGGSVITHKRDHETVDEEALARAAAAVGDVGDSVVVVHGAGSFGHPHADRHGVTTTSGTADSGAVVEIHGAMRRLNATVVEELRREGVPAVPVAPFSAASRDREGTTTLETAAVATMLDSGFVPVLHGDVVAHAGEGATILSGDEVVVELATRLDADRVGLCSAVPGVLDQRGEVVTEITRFEDVAAVLEGSDATDVTGGMAGKVKTMLSLDAPASVFGLDGLAAFLDGETPGTTIRGPE